MNSTLEALRRDGPSAEAESAALGQWLLEREGLVTVAPDSTLHRVPFAREADWIAWVLDDRVAVVRRTDTTVREGVNLAGEPRDTVVLGLATPEVGPSAEHEQVWLRGALVRTALMAHALDAICRLSLEYAQQRVQFGRPIARFQAVQAHLVGIAQQAALVDMAFQAAAATEAPFEIAAAKTLAGRAALTAARAAHQVHGARGTTLEHPLSLHTRRLWAWRSEFGSERHWSARLGSAAEAAGADRLYPAVTAGSGELDV